MNETRALGASCCAAGGCRRSLRTLVDSKAEGATVINDTDDEDWLQVGIVLPAGEHPNALLHMVPTAALRSKAIAVFLAIVGVGGIFFRDFT